MNQTFQNSAQVLSIGIFFTLMIVGLASTLPHTMSAGLEAHGVDAGDRPARRRAAAGLDPVRRLPRLQPDPEPARPARAARALAAHDRAAVTGVGLLPAAHLGPVPAACTRRSRSRSWPASSPRPRRCCAAAASTTATWRSSHDRRSNMHVEWFGQSTFRLVGGDVTVLIDPFGDMSAARRARAAVRLSAARGRDADLLLVTHEHSTTTRSRSSAAIRC